MSSSYANLETLNVLWVYIFVYNIALILFFFSLFQYLVTTTPTLYSFASLGSTNFLSKLLLILIFSMAGVPPFWGFFTKMFLFVLLLNTRFFILFYLFFTLLFVGLYFYIQNVRFLNANAGSKFLPVTDFTLHLTPLYFYLALLLSISLVFGFLLTDDCLLIVLWCFI